MLRHDLKSFLNIKLHPCMLTDRKSLFDTIVRSPFITEKRLMIDVCAAAEAYQKLKISDVGHIDGKNNSADELTQPKYCAALVDLLQSGVVMHKVNQWVFRHDQSVLG